MWAFDEHRIGLKPVLRRVWSKRGQPFVALVEPRYQWSYLHGFVEPESGATFWWLTNWVDVEAFSLVLHEFALWHQVSEEAPVLLVLDQAGWHRSDEVDVPPGITFVFLPPYSPELQPAEKLWPLSNEVLVNRRFDSLEHLEQEQSRRCQQLLQQPELIRNRTLFHWWPR